MAIVYGTLAQLVDGIVEYIYPTTAATVVEYDEIDSVKSKIEKLILEFNEITALVKNVIDNDSSLEVYDIRVPNYNLVPDGTTYATAGAAVRDQFEIVLALINDIISNIDDLMNRCDEITNINTKLTVLTNTVNNLKTAVNEYSSVASNVEINNEKIYELEQSVIDINNILDTLNGMSGSIDDKIAELEALINTTNTSISELESIHTSDISNITTRLNNINTSIINIRSDISNLSTSINTITSDINVLKSQHNSDIENINSNIDNLNDLIAALTATVNIIKQDITSINTKLNNKIDKPSDGGIAGQVLQNNGDGTTSWVNPDNGSADINELKIEVNNIKTNINNINDEINSINSEIDSKASNSDLNNAINSLTIMHDADIENLNDNKVDKPFDPNGSIDDGTRGQVLQTNGDGTTDWVNRLDGAVLTEEFGEYKTLVSRELENITNILITTATQSYVNSLYAQLVQIHSDDISTHTSEINRVETIASGKLNKPSSNGSSGQILQSNGDGTTSWVNKPSGDVTAQDLDNLRALHVADMQTVNNTLATKATTTYVDSSVNTLKTTHNSDIQTINNTLATKATTTYVDNAIDAAIGLAIAASY